MSEPATAPERQGRPETIKLDIEMMRVVRSRLSLDQFGRLSVQIARAAAAKRPSELQSLLLAIVSYEETTP